MSDRQSDRQMDSLQTDRHSSIMFISYEQISMERDRQPDRQTDPINIMFISYEQFSMEMVQTAGQIQTDRQTFQYYVYFL